MRKAMLVLLLGVVLAACGKDEDKCCKHCKDSQPCGDTCIPNNQTCHTNSGCACAG
jgi:hypothetical protein